MNLFSYLTIKSPKTLKEHVANIITKYNAKNTKGMENYAQVNWSLDSFVLFGNDQMLVALSECGHDEHSLVVMEMANDDAMNAFVKSEASQPEYAKVLYLFHVNSVNTWYLYARNYKQDIVFAAFDDPSFALDDGFCALVRDRTVAAINSDQEIYLQILFRLKMRLYDYSKFAMVMDYELSRISASVERSSKDVALVVGTASHLLSFADKFPAAIIIRVDVNPFVYIFDKLKAQVIIEFAKSDQSFSREKLAQAIADAIVSYSHQGTAFPWTKESIVSMLFSELGVIGEPHFMHSKQRLLQVALSLQQKEITWLNVNLFDAVQMKQLALALRGYVPTCIYLSNLPDWDQQGKIFTNLTLIPHDKNTAVMWIKSGDFCCAKLAGLMGQRNCEDATSVASRFACAR